MILRRALPALLFTAIALGISAASMLAQNEPAELTQARAVYQKDVEFATRPIRDRYVTRLEALKRGFGSRGDAKSAIALQDEIDRVKAAGTEAAGIAKFAGVWHLTYDTNGTRRYMITADGAVTWSEDNGKPIAPRKAKIIAKGTEFVLDFKEDPAIERLNISGNNLAVEYFNPKANYPATGPQNKAVGRLVSPNKN